MFYGVCATRTSKWSCREARLARTSLSQLLSRRFMHVYRDARRRPSLRVLCSVHQKHHQPTTSLKRRRYERWRPTHSIPSADGTLPQLSATLRASPPHRVAYTEWTLDQNYAIKCDMYHDRDVGARRRIKTSNLGRIYRARGIYGSALTASSTLWRSLSPTITLSPSAMDSQ